MALSWSAVALILVVVVIVLMAVQPGAEPFIDYSRYPYSLRPRVYPWAYSWHTWLYPWRHPWRHTPVIPGSAPGNPSINAYPDPAYPYWNNDLYYLPGLPPYGQRWSPRRWRHQQ